MIIPFREIHTPIMLIAVIIGYQISSYFIWQYFNNKSKSIGLNKLLLAFGIFIGISVTSLISRISIVFYMEDLSLSDLTANLAGFVILLSIIAFLIVMCFKMFSEISNIALTHVIVFILLIVSILLSLMALNSPITVYLLFLNLFGFSYMFFIQTRLLKLTTGDVKKRFKKILGGELIFGIGLLFGGGEINQYNLPFDNIYSIVLIIATVIGLMFISLGIYRFPAFLEFGWRENLLKLFIIDQNRLKGLYVHDFNDNAQDVETGEMTISKEDREYLFSKGIIGVEEVINNIITSKKKRLEKIEHGNLLILLNYGDPPFSFITYALLVKKTMKSLEFILKVMKDQFQGFYKDLLLNLKNFEGNEEKLFSSFDLIISNLTR